MIKAHETTITLTGSEQKLQFAEAHPYYWVHNLGGSEVLLSLSANITYGKDGVVIVPSGSGGCVRHGMGTDTVYVSGTGTVQVIGTYSAHCPFKAAPKGGGEITSDGAVSVRGTVEYPTVALSLYGKSTQDGVPTPEEPAPIVSVGDDGDLVITTDNGGTIKLSAEIISGLPLCSVGDVRDELIHNIDGTGKVIKRTGVVTFDGSDDESWYLSSNYSRIVTGVCSDTAISAKSTYDVVASLCNRLTPVAAVDTWLGKQGISFETEDAKGHIHICISSLVGNSDLTAWTSWLADNPLTVVYQLAEPQEIELSAAEMSALRALQSYSSVTNVYNDENAEMSVKVCTNTMLSEYVYPIIKGQQKRIEELEAAVLSLGGNV